MLRHAPAELALCFFFFFFFFFLFFLLFFLFFFLFRFFFVTQLVLVPFVSSFRDLFLALPAKNKEQASPENTAPEATTRKSTARGIKNVKLLMRNRTDKKHCKARYISSYISMWKKDKTTTATPTPPTTATARQLAAMSNTNIYIAHTNRNAATTTPKPNQSALTTSVKRFCWAFLTSFSSCTCHQIHHATHLNTPKTKGRR